ncbi:MAG: arabinogalactan endo-1,4-beta-galactosidase [Muribaculaceae bacterium]|nr:arabinogalactan endo-1,4-beta-galactosidase [Muribaculaceae bacterium]
MKSNHIIISALITLLSSLTANSSNPFRYVGGDVSLLPDYEEADAKYYDGNGKPISDLLSFCHDEGMNCMRVRLFVNPDEYDGPEADPNAKQDLEYIIPLCQRIQEDGFALLLDFHYSDTWADPGKQWTPKAWEGLSDTELYQKIYDYTKETLQTLGRNGIKPEFIQPGNEISYGMLWGPAGTENPKKVFTSSDTNWNRFHNLLSNAIQACREECPDAKIIIHTERVAEPSYLRDFYNRLNSYKLDYDIIGLSYYPYFHGSLSVLKEALTLLENSFEKDMMIVETGFPYAWEVPGTNQPGDYPYSEAGQYSFAKDLVSTLLGYERCTGLLWWWFEYNANGTALSGWYNAPLFDSRTGKVTKAFAEICSFGSGPYQAGVSPILNSNISNSSQWYDIHGHLVTNPTTPGIYINNGRTVIK